MEKKKQENHFVNKSTLAERYDICVKTLNRYIARLQDKLPLYCPGDNLFTPAQVKVIDYHLIHVGEDYPATFNKKSANL